jgi:chromosome partitioning protein
MKIVSVLNHKGGVGKTTFAGCTAQALALVGFRVLAIDNDSQHNLSTMLGCGVCEPNLHSVYSSAPAAAPQIFLRTVRATGLANLHMVTTSRELCDHDVPDIHFLKNCLRACNLERFYDYILIDNGPGMDRLQISALYASHEVFVPTELRQFAVDGIVEMDNVLEQRFSDAAKITRIIPNFYRNTTRQNSFIAALEKMFPGKVTKTAIVTDAVFDECITENKILFLHRLSSRGAAYYIKLIHELFDLSEEKVWEMVKNKRYEMRRDEARERFGKKINNH